LKRYEFRFCALAVPDDWIQVPPLGLAEAQSGEDRLSLMVSEQWLPEPVTAAEHGKQQAELLARVLDDFKLIASQPWLDPRIGWAATFEYENEERLTSREMRVWRSQGPQLIGLMLLGPGGPNRGRDQVFEAIARSFEPQGGEVFARLERTPLLAALEDKSRPPADPAAVRERFPQVTISLAVPRGWEAAAEKGQAVLRRSGFELRARRVLEHGNKTDLWFERKMKQLRDSGSSLVMAWSQGTLAGGSPYAAVAYDETALSRTWTTAADQRSLEAAISGRQLVEWSIRCPSSSFRDAQAILQGVIASSESLDPLEWETCPPEPWIDLVLKGPWEAAGPGTYTKKDSSFVLLQLAAQESHSPLEVLRPRLLEGLRRAVAVRRPTEKESTGLFRGLDALHWKGDGRMAVRGVWVRAEELLYSCVLSGTEPQETDELFRLVASRLNPPGAQEERP
jgi:hypothetical protein